MNNPIVSIITVVFNSKDHIEKTINSVINQDFNSKEYIVIDGGSTDGTLEIVNSYESVIDVIISEPDNGIYDAMNKGIMNASGKYCLFLNSGDLLFNENTLNGLRNHLRNNYGVIYGKAFFFSPEEGIDFVFGREVELSDFYLRMPICHQAIFFNTDMFKELGDYDTQFRIKADHEWMLRYFKSATTEALYVDEVIARYNMIGYAVTNKLQSIKEFKIISRKYLPLLPRITYEFKYPLLWVKYKIYEQMRGSLILKIYRSIKYS